MREGGDIYVVQAPYVVQSMWLCVCDAVYVVQCMRGQPEKGLGQGRARLAARVWHALAWSWVAHGT